MAAAISTLLRDPSHLQRCKLASRRAAEEVFFWEKEEEKLLKLYSTLQQAQSTLGAAKDELAVRS
jgi:glycosyltransferase involved in cell wall biosynthesis